MESKSLHEERLNELLKSKQSLSDEIVKLKRTSDIENYIERAFFDLIIKTADKSHVRELAELWANLASLQQFHNSDRYNFNLYKKDWINFVEHKISKKNNLLLVAYNLSSSEIKGFLYLQTITIPSSDLVFKGVIEDIYTKPQYRKQNIASSLINVAFQWSKYQGIKQINIISLIGKKELKLFFDKVLKKLDTDVSVELVTI